MLTQERVREIHQLWVRCKYKKASVLPTDCAATLPSLPFPERLASDSSTRKLLWVPFSRLLTWPTKLCLTFLDGVIPAYFFFFLTHLNLILGKLREKKKKLIAVGVCSIQTSSDYSLPEKSHCKYQCIDGNLIQAMQIHYQWDTA